MADVQKTDLETQVTRIIYQIGIPAHIKGYQYLRTAILLTIQDSNIINSVTTVLYPSVAQQYQTTASFVERAIRHAIEIAWDRGDPDTLNSYFGYTIQNTRGKPTNIEFIAMIADKLRLEQENNPLKTQVTKTLHQLCVPANIKGYQYLRTAILLAVQNIDIINNLSKELYPPVAQKYQTTPSCVESAIRHAIKVAWDRGDVATLNSYFGYTMQDSGKPSNSEFIAMIADNLRLKYKLYY